jgi:FMN reductase
VDLTGFFF